jgi:hypothetical protein
MKLTEPIKPLTDRGQILSEVKRRLEVEVTMLTKEIKSMQGVKGLSKDNIAYNVSKLEQSVKDVERLIGKVDQLKNSRQKAHLLICQYGMGKAPTNGDGYYLCTDSTEWEGARSIPLCTEYSGKPAGARWSAFHSRAEQDEFFHLFSRI